MTLEKLKTILDSTGIPVVYRAWPENEAPAMPYICYLSDGSNNFMADGIAYHQIMKVRIELYTQKVDEDVQSRIESVLAKAGICWNSEPEYIDSEKCYQTTYEIEV